MLMDKLKPLKIPPQYIWGKEGEGITLPPYINGDRGNGMHFLVYETFPSKTCGPVGPIMHVIGIPREAQRNVICRAALVITFAARRFRGPGVLSPAYILNYYTSVKP